MHSDTYSFFALRTGRGSTGDGRETRVPGSPLAAMPAKDHLAPSAVPRSERHLWRLVMGFWCFFFRFEPLVGGNGLQVLQIGLSSCTGDELSITPEGLALVLRAANSGV